MRINPNTNQNVNFYSSWYDKFFEKIPNKDIKNIAKYNKAGSVLASPHWNRVAIGLAAISSQPWIDYFNPNVDKETAKASSLRTTAKIIVCTSVGFVVRGLSYKLVEKFANGTPQEGSTILTPKSILQESNEKLRNSKLKIHKNAFSTITALSIMLFTNFLLDAPLTSKLSNKFLKMANLDKKQGGSDEKRNF